MGKAGWRGQSGKAPTILTVIMEASAGTGISFASVVESREAEHDGVTTHAAGPAGALPISAEMLLTEPSGNLFGLTQNAGMGWEPARLLDPEFLILSTHGGLRAEDGTPIALGFHTGHWEVGLLVAEAARELKALHAVPFAGACTDPCDGRTQGTTGMMDSLPYRNDAAMVLRRLMRSLPTRQGRAGRGHLRQGSAGDDDGAGFGRYAARRAGARRGDAAAGVGRGCGQGADNRRAVRAAADHAGVCGGGGMPRLRIARRWLPVSGNGGDVAGGGRGAGAVAAAHGAGSIGAGRSGWMRRSARRGRCCGCIKFGWARRMC